MKDTFFKSTIILLMGGFLTKILGMIIKVIMTRIVGLEGMSLYMLVFPTFSLFTTISQLGLPTALSKIISEDNHNNKNVILSIIPISLVFNILLIILTLIISPLISGLLNDERTLIPIISIIFVLPIDSLSNILRGYFFGKQRMIPHILSLLIEQIVRLSLIVFFIPKIIYKGLTVTVSFLILINMISELISLITLILFIKDKRIKKSDFIPNKKEIHNIFSISIPTTLSRLIGSISYFLEPIIITSLLSINGFNINYIINEYGIIEGFILPLLLMPSFLTNALSSAIIPDIAKKSVTRDILGIKRRIKQVISISLIIGISTSLILFINPGFFLNLIYKTNKGINYLKILIPFFVIFYIQYPLESILQGLGKAKEIMKNNTIGIISKIVIIIILSFIKIGIYNLVIGIIINIIITTILHIKKIKEILH